MCGGSANKHRIGGLTGGRREGMNRRGRRANQTDDKIGQGKWGEVFPGTFDRLPGTAKTVDMLKKKKM